MCGIRSRSPANPVLTLLDSENSFLDNRNGYVSCSGVHVSFRSWQAGFAPFPPAYGFVYYFSLVFAPWVALHLRLIPSLAALPPASDPKPIPLVAFASAVLLTNAFSLICFFVNFPLPLIHVRNYKIHGYHDSMARLVSKAEYQYFEGRESEPSHGNRDCDFNRQYQAH